MSTHCATIRWQRGGVEFALTSYSRDHTWRLSGDQTVRASAPAAYRGDPGLPAPEEALVASLSSCHMLTFLAVAAEQGFVVNAYEDAAVGHLEKNADGKMAITRIELRPKVEFEGDAPDDAKLQEMHDEAHEYCFIARSITTEVSVTPQ